MRKIDFPLIVIFLVALTMRLLWFFYTDNLGYGDAAARLNIAQNWAFSFWRIPSITFREIFNPSVDWLPLHFYLIGIVSYLFNDMVYAPRLFTLLVSVFTVIPLYKLCVLKFNKSTATIAILLLAFWGMHIFLSSLTLSETFYFFFLLWSYYFIEKYYKEGKEVKHIFLLSISLSACCLLRYEAWVFVPLVIITIPFLKKITLRNFALFLLFPALAVGFVMACEIIQGQHPLRGILFSDFEVKLSNDFYGAIDYTNLLPSYLPLYFLAAIFFFKKTILTKNKVEYLLFALYFLPILPFIIKLANGSVTTQARYLSIYMIPGILVIAWFINALFQKYHMAKSAKAVFLVGYIFIANFSLAKYIKEDRLKIKYANGFMQSAVYFKDSIVTSKAYIDYGSELSNCNWMVYADLYDAINSEQFIDSIAKANHVDATVFIQRARKGARYRVTGHEYEWRTWSKENFDKLLSANQLTHIVLFPSGLLSKQLNFSKPQEVYLNKKFIQIFSKGGYQIYKIE